MIVIEYIILLHLRKNKPIGSNLLIYYIKYYFYKWVKY